jgi:hypothetical protein
MTDLVRLPIGRGCVKSLVVFTVFTELDEAPTVICSHV